LRANSYFKVTLVLPLAFLIDSESASGTNCRCENRACKPVSEALAIDAAKAEQVQYPHEKS